MNREGALLVMVAIAAVLLALMAWGWTRRRRRDATPLIAPSDLPTGSAIRAAFDGFYVATTAHDAPLERIAAPGLGFRSRAGITVADSGVALDIPGQQRIVLPVARIEAVAQSTVAIDRAVERDGLVRIDWTTDAGTTVDTYLRAADAPALALADAIRSVLPDADAHRAAPTPTTPAPTTGAPTGGDA
jgi:hypothetical protein